MQQILSAIVAIVVGVGAMVLYFWGTNWLLDRLLPDRVDPDGIIRESRETAREAIRPWLFVFPAIALLGLYLVYPAIQTVYLSFGNANGEVRMYESVYPDAVDDMPLGLNAPLTEDRLVVVQDNLGEVYPALNTLTADDISSYETVGDIVDFAMAEAGEEAEQVFILFRNYQWAFNSTQFWESVRNNVLWLLVPFLSTVFGLLAAVLADRVRWGTIAKSFIFMPMAISFVGASVIWKFVYDIRPEGQPQIGLINAILATFGLEPQPWIALSPWNNFFLMIILIWIQTGFAMVLLSAALRGVPEETIEAGRIDGASEVRIFFNIIIPQIMSTILVVLTTITITVLKVFDIVAAMTNGQFGTQVLANLMYDQAFRASHDGRGSVVAVFIMIAVIPIMVWNIRQFQQEEQLR
ncbi:MAG: carbohydrate ABC transporter permease [Anaerolineae bacterium]